MKIENIKVNKILDSRGEWTIEVDVLSEGIREKASIPSGKSKGSYEAMYLTYEEIQKNLEDLLKEIKNLDFKTSREFDQFLIERAGKNKEKLGANFTLGISIAFVRALAKKENLELWEYLSREYANRYELETKQYGKIYIPGLIINIIGGGVHSFNNLDFQEYWLITHTKYRLYTDFSDTMNLSEQSGLDQKELALKNVLEKILDIIKKLEKKLPQPLGRNDEGAFCTNFSDNYEPFLYLREFKNDFQLGADIAANQINKNLNWKEIYERLKNIEIEYLEDPFKEDEFENFTNLRKEGFKVIGDDLTVTNVERLKIALEKDSIDGVIVKPNQVGTILETFEFVKLAKENNLFTVFSHRSGETNDYWIVDLGVAFNTDFFKIGPPIQGERIAKYNRLIEILRKDSEIWKIY